MIIAYVNELFWELRDLTMHSLPYIFILDQSLIIKLSFVAICAIYECLNMISNQNKEYSCVCIKISLKIIKQ